MEDCGYDNIVDSAVFVMLLHNMPEPGSFIAPQCINTVSETSPAS